MMAGCEEKGGSPMKRKWGVLRMTAAICLLLAASCSTTTMSAVWKDPGYQGGSLKKVLVIGVARNDVIRRLFEDEFSAQLKAHGMDAYPSYRLIPSTQILAEDTVNAKIENLGMDAVLVTRFVNTKKETVYTPGTAYYSGGWYNWYSAGYGYVTSPGYYSEYEVISLSTNIYDTQTGKMIWSGLSDTVTGGSAQTEIKGLIDVITKRLTKDGLIS
jgi:hypothetical protein